MAPRHETTTVDQPSATWPASAPEIVAKAWPELQTLCTPVVVGDPLWLRRGLDLSGSSAQVALVKHPTEADPSPDVVAWFAGQVNRI